MAEKEVVVHENLSNWLNKSIFNLIYGNRGQRAPWINAAATFFSGNAFFPLLSSISHNLALYTPILAVTGPVSLPTLAIASAASAGLSFLTHVRHNALATPMPDKNNKPVKVAANVGELVENTVGNVLFGLNRQRLPKFRTFLGGVVSGVITGITMGIPFGVVGGLVGGAVNGIFSYLAEQRHRPLEVRMPVATPA